ncbi:22226_t:CDS:2, partial [Entrophospora sp. SA101]
IDDLLQTLTLLEDMAKNRERDLDKLETNFTDFINSLSSTSSRGSFTINIKQTFKDIDGDDVNDNNNSHNEYGNDSDDENDDFLVQESQGGNIEVCAWILLKRTYGSE